MKKQKIVKEFIYYGLGFPVKLLRVPVVEIRGVWTPDINYNVLQKAVLLALAHHPSELSGNHIRFFRVWLGLTQIEFGKRLGVTHPAVVKWEKSKNKAAKMALTAQRELRLLILDQLLRNDKAFRKAYRTIHTLDFSPFTESLAVDATKELIAV